MRLVGYDQIEKATTQLACIMKDIALPHETIAIHADISRSGVILILSAIRAGLNVALCPVREPVSVINIWLKELGIKKLLSEHARSDLLTAEIEQFSMEDLLLETNLSSSGLTRESLDPRVEPEDDNRGVGLSFSSIIRTSGTSGRPKNALIPLLAHRASAQAVNDYFQFTKDCTWALNLPLYHVSGLGILFRVLAADASIHIAKTHEEMVRAVSAHEITHLSLVPRQLKRLLDDEVDLSHVKAVIIGGDALPDDERRRVLAKRLPIYETYGLTETASMVWVRDVLRDEPGMVLPHATMKLADDGEIVVGGQSLFLGYVEDGHLDRACLANGLFKTGDFGQTSLPLIIGRKSNRIIYGGENIQAEEIERLLDAHPSISESIVLGIKDADFGMRPCAYIKWRNEPVSDDQLASYLRTKLASFKVPQLFLPWPKDAPIGIKKPRAWFSALIS